MSGEAPAGNARWVWWWRGRERLGDGAPAFGGVEDCISNLNLRIPLERSNRIRTRPRRTPGYPNTFPLPVEPSPVRAGREYLPPTLAPQLGEWVQ